RQERQGDPGAVRRARAARRHRLYLLAEEPQARGLARRLAARAHARQVLPRMSPRVARLLAWRKKWARALRYAEFRRLHANSSAPVTEIHCIIAEAVVRKRSPGARFDGRPNVHG